MEKQQYIIHEEAVLQALTEISQISEWLAGLNTETHEVPNGLACILTDLRDKADFAYNMITTP